jgi:hypothetical protein
MQREQLHVVSEYAELIVLFDAVEPPAKRPKHDRELLSEYHDF